MEIFLLSTQNIRFGEKHSAYWSCIAIFLAKVCLFAQKRRLIETFLLSTQTMRFVENNGEL